MHRHLLLILLFVAFATRAAAQQDEETALGKLLQLTATFHGKQPYACNAIVEVTYPGRSVSRDTSRLIYQNGSTYYKSRLVERVEAPQGALLINHELKTASFELSDSLRSLLQKEAQGFQNKELESMLDPDFAQTDMDEFKKYVLKDCKTTWSHYGNGIQEITIKPKIDDKATLTLLNIKFEEPLRVLYYEYVNRDIYASDLNGNSRFRVIRTIYQSFNYNKVPEISAKLSDFLQWNGWTITLKRYTNYKLSVL